MEDTAQLGEDKSPHTQHSWSEQGLGLRFSDVPLENFTSPAPLPSGNTTGQEQERLLSAIEKVEPDLMM